ncbi:MAG TPA: periplasmic heavy metal sensor [Dongiaceae bacterium]|jgi:Spy/CpxP family protein refolding chaperone|nr:periplasmic heavy metal sensor [Dongiaceae bacterium]
MSWRPSRRLLAIVLFISVVLNLFLGGITLGRMLHGDIWPWENPYVHEFGFFAGRAVQKLVRDLDTTDRDIVVDALRAHRDQLLQLSAAMHDQRQKVEVLMRAPQFDRKAMEESFAEMRKRGDDMQAALGAAILDAIEKLPPDARQRLGK